MIFVVYKTMRYSLEVDVERRLVEAASSYLPKYFLPLVRDI